MRTNLQRATNGRDLASLAATGSYTIDPDDYHEGIVDALTNLLHFARMHGLDFDAALDTAYRHHAHESRYGWDAVPD